VRSDEPDTLSLVDLVVERGDEARDVQSLEREHAFAGITPDQPQPTVCSEDGGGGGPVVRNRRQRVSAAFALGANVGL
jgi:hypothetical protein